MKPPSPRARVFALSLLAALGPLLLLWLTGYITVRSLWVLLVWAPILFFASDLLVRPLSELATVAQRLRQGQLQARPSIPLLTPWDEIAQTMGGLAERLDQAQRHFEREVNARTRQLTRQANQLRALGQVGQQVAAVLEPSELLHFVVRVVRGTFAYDLVAVIKDEGDHLVLSACAVRGVAEVPLGRAFSKGDPCVRSLLEGMQGEGALSDSPCRLIGSVPARSQLTVPIRLGERTIGAIVVQSLTDGAFDDDDMFTARTIAGQVAVALENARLFVAERELRQLAITEERHRMAREIHDTLAQGFMGILMHLRAMEGSKDPQAAAVHRAQAELLAREGLEEARRSVWNLRPERLEQRGLRGALEDEVSRLQQRAGLRVNLSIAGDTESVSPQVAAGVLRIVQESLHNTLRHARASQADVRLTVNGERLELCVSDDGVGFDPTAPRRSSELGGFGLNGMRERALVMGGELIIDAAPNRGTKITVRIPKRR